jgi:hypothetical protein
MSIEQMVYFANLGRQIDSGVFPDVVGNISYLFTYTYILMEKWEKIGFEELRKMLMTLCHEYRAEAKFVEYCSEWASHCLLGMGRFDEFLAATEPTDPFSKDCRLPAMRCDVLHHLGRAANPVDLLKMSNVDVSEYTRKYPQEFREHLAAAFAEEEAKSGPWLARLLPLVARPCGITLFDVVVAARLDKPAVVPIESRHLRKNIEIISGAVREAENKLRDERGVPRIGEGWISETELFNLIRDSFPGVTVEHHGKPAWLGRQHLDVWIPDWKIAVEYHGDQHFRPVDFFGGETAFVANQERDRRKERLCRENGVNLFVVSEIGKAEELLAAIKEARGALAQRQPASPGHRSS